MKLLTIRTVGKAEVGRVREEKKRSEKIREEKKREERKMQLREKVGFTVFSNGLWLQRVEK